MWLSLMHLVAFSYAFLYNNISSKIEMERKVHVLGISKNINRNTQFKDKVMNEKSLKLIGFFCHRGAKKHAK